MHEEYVQLLENKTISDRTAQKWFAKFSSGVETLEDEPRLGRPKQIDDELRD